MTSRTKIKNRVQRKTNLFLRETINQALENPTWSEVAKLISSPRRNHSRLNLFQIDAKSAVGDTILIPGKILSKGNLTKKIRICALSISEKAREKLKETKSEFVPIIEEIKKNKKAEGIKVLR